MIFIGENVRSLPHGEQTHHFEKETPKLQIVQQFYSFQLAGAAPVWQLNGKSSTWFPLGRLVEWRESPRGAPQHFPPRHLHRLPIK